MAKYRVLERLTSISTGRDILPGETIEIEDENTASILLDKNCIAPAEVVMPKPGTTKIKEE